MFDKVIGHDKQKDILMNDIKNNKISHAYAFVGPMGVGKKMLAREFAKQILNIDKLELAIDYKETQKNDGKKNILVEQIRKDIVQDVYIHPAIGEYKVYVIENAECLNEEAQNALLKTLEEPPSYVCIILITQDVHCFLPTIISRVKQVKFDKLTDIQIKEYCRKNSVNEEFDDNMLSYIDGSIGKLESLKQETEIPLFKQMEELVQYMIKKDELKLMQELEKVSFKSTNALDYIEYLLYLNNKYDELFVISEARNKLQYNVNEDILKTTIAINICRKEK